MSSGVNASEWVQKTRSAFISSSKFKIIESVPNSLVPIQIVQHVATGWKCNISFSHGFGVENSLFVMHLLEMQPEAKKLAFFVQIWCKKFGIAIKNFTLTVLVIFYLQTKSLMPSVKQVQDRCCTRKIGGQFKSLNFINLIIIFCI